MIGARRIEISATVMALGLVLLYVFLYAPILYVIYTSFASDVVWPFPLNFTLIAYEDLFASSLYGEALSNSLKLAFGSAVISTLLAAGGAIAVLRYRSKRRGLVLFLFIAPLFVA